MMKHLIVESMFNEELSSRMPAERAQQMAEDLDGRGFGARVVPCTGEEALICDCRIEDYPP